MKKNLFIFVIALLCGQFASSQTFYEFKYHYTDSVNGTVENYRSLLLRNDDGSGIMRVEYYDTDVKSRVIVEMNIQEYYMDNDDGTVDSTRLIIYGMDVKEILGAANFSPDHFLFKSNDEGIFEPFAVFTLDDDTSYTEGIIDNVRLLNEADLTEELVLQYFTKEEDFYKDLFETTTRSLSEQEKQTRLFVLLVANTNDKIIGRTCEVDLKNTLDTYTQLAEFLEIQLVPKVISGTAFSKVNVDNAINAMRPSESDIVVFYYTGHGFNEQKGSYKFPYLDLRDKTYQEYGGQYTMNMEAIFQKIKTKGARFNLVYSDCCNNDPAQSQNMTSEDPVTKVSSVGWDRNKCIALFLNPKRMSVLATAAQKGELSAGNVAEGGFFTANFLGTLEKHIGKLRTTEKPLDANWNSILTMSTKETTARAVRKWCRMPDNSVKKCNQHPVSKME